MNAQTPVRVTPVPHRGTLLVLACIPTVDCIANQLNNALHLELGGASMLQVMRGCLVLVFLFLIARTLWQEPARVSALPLAGLIAVLGLAVFVSKEMLVSGVPSAGSMRSYGQMAYWLLLWTIVSLLVRSRRQAEILLKGLAVGGMLTALSVIAGLLAGAGNYYESDAVEASAGWFDTAKMISGVLVVSGVILLYLGRDNRRWRYSIGALVCFGACVLTYARAGVVALCVVLLWLLVWRVFLSRDGSGRWLNPLLVLLLGAAMIAPLAIDAHSLLARWSDLGDSQKAGSGRATFWKLAIEAYVDEDLTQQTLGVGYGSMSEVLLREYGDDIKHTHNDMFDMLLVGGLVGAVWLLILIGTFVRQALLPSLHSRAGAAAIAIVLAYLCHGMLTGQIWGTDAMSYYTLSLLCITRIREKEENSRPAAQMVADVMVPLPVLTA